jgi:hypothetical protein
MADALGFDGLWLNDEHFQGSNLDVEGRRCLSPLILAAAIVARKASDWLFCAPRPAPSSRRGEVPDAALNHHRPSGGDSRSCRGKRIEDEFS